MTGWVWWVVAVAGFVVTYRKLYVVLLPEFAASAEPEPVDRAFTGAVCLVSSLLWPILWAGWLLWMVLTPTTTAERLAAAKRKKAAAERAEREVAAAEADVARRWRDLGLNG